MACHWLSYAVEYDHPKRTLMALALSVSSTEVLDPQRAVGHAEAVAACAAAVGGDGEVRVGDDEGVVAGTHQDGRGDHCHIVNRQGVAAAAHVD